MNTMTFQEMIETGATLYPDEVDEATRRIIQEWFQFRYVTDNDRFPVYFHRVLLRDYSRYKQLLRIEAGKQGDRGIETSYDWLVTDYLERYEKRDTERESTSETEVTNSVTRSGSGSSTQGGTTGTATTGHVSFAPGTTTGTDITTTDSGTTHDETSTEGTSESHTANDSESRAQALSKTTPNTASYSVSDLDHNNDSVGYIKRRSDGKFTTGYKPYDEQEDHSKTSYIQNLRNRFPNPNITNPTSVSDSFTATAALGEAAGEESTEVVSDGTTSNSSTTNQRVVRGGVDTTSTQGSQTVTHGMTVNTTETGTESGSSGSETTGTETGTDTSKTQHTGRGGEIAEILKHVQSYIRNSSSFNWLRGQLETCFIANLDY